MHFIIVTRVAKVSHKEQTDWGLLMRQMKQFSDKFDVPQINENSAVCEFKIMPVKVKN